MLAILQIIMPIFFVIFVGFVVGKRDLLGSDALPVLNKLIYYIFLPALIFSMTSTADPAALARVDFALLFALASIATVAFTGVGLLFFTGKRSCEKILFVMSGSIGNTGYIGIPLLLGALGKVGGVAAITGTILVNTTFTLLTVTLLDLFRSERKSLAANISKTLKNPFILSACLGLACNFSGVDLPDFADKIVEMMGAPTISLALFTIGLSLAVLVPQRQIVLEACWLSFAKIIVSPLLVLVLAPLFPNLDPVWLASAVLLAATPVANNNYVIASNVGCYVEECATSVLFSTAASVITLVLFISYLN